MPRKVKPKHQQRFGGTFSIESPISDDDFVRIAKTLKVKDLADSSRKELLDIAHEYRLGVELAKNHQASPEIRYILERVYEKARDLSECLKTVDDASREKIELRLTGAFVPQMRSYVCPFCECEFLDEAGFQNHLSGHEIFSSAPNAASPDILERCQADAERIAHAARDALKSVSSKPGTKRSRTSLYRTVNRLGIFYQEITGQQAKIHYSAISERYSGPFLKFVTSFLFAIEARKNVPSVKTIANLIMNNPIPSANR